MTFVHAFLAWLAQRYCALRYGHDTLLQFEQDRMFLRCVSCGHETPGWQLDAPPPVPKWSKLIRFRRRMVA